MSEKVRLAGTRFYTEARRCSGPIPQGLFFLSLPASIFFCFVVSFFFLPLHTITRTTRKGRMRTHSCHKKKKEDRVGPLWMRWGGKTHGLFSRSNLPAVEHRCDGDNGAPMETVHRRARSQRQTQAAERTLESSCQFSLQAQSSALRFSKTAKVLLIAVLPVIAEHVSDALFVFPLTEHPLTAPHVRGCHLAPPSSAFCAQRCAPSSHPPRTFTHAHILRIAHTYSLTSPSETLVLAALRSPSLT